MNVTSKFDIGAVVWTLSERTEREVEVCSVCQGAGKLPVVGVDQLIGCPKCYGRGETDTGETFRRFMVSSTPLTVGQVRVMVEGPTYGNDDDRFGRMAVDQSNMGPRSYKTTEEYMCVETGVGSGTIHRAHNLFASQEEATAEALRRTKASQDAIQRYDEVGRSPSA